MPDRPLRSEVKAITPPPLALSGGRGVEVGASIGGTVLAVGETGVGGESVVVGGTVAVAGKTDEAVCNIGTAEG